MEPKKKTNKRFVVITTALILMGGTYGVYKFVHSLSHEDTDDAQVEAHMSPVIPHVGGYVRKVNVKDNQIVKKGDTLFIIDNRDYLVELEQAKAQLAAAESGLVVSQASI
ncbi:MAG: biotin/lipoyl-binding protein, partial [Bacteroidota bacterium]|nr:biotin/lipoyl-binding protein [Bacteroidota bacterium]